MRFFIKQVITGHGADDVYLLRYRIGRLALHIFYRGDHDPDPHDHPHDFWTFPLTPYVEQVVTPAVISQLHTDRVYYNPTIIPPSERTSSLVLVPAFKITKRDATHTHRVLGRWNGYSETRTGYEYRGAPLTNQHKPQVGEGKIITIVWRGPKKRSWGFVKNRGNLWCWSYYRDYFRGERDGGCD